MEEVAKAPVPSDPYINDDFDVLPLCCNALAMEITSPGVWIDGVEGAELGPAVFPVPVLFAGPDEDAGCFLFRPFCPFVTVYI